MKKTSKKLLSFFLAVVMIVTSCSVGFTAFAKDSNTAEKYWNDSTSASEAFEKLNDLVDSYVPMILGIEIEKGKNLGSLLGMGEDEIKNATLSQVVSAASPLLLGALGGNGDKKTILMEANGVPSYPKSYDLYYSYLDGSESDAMSFYDLYQFCSDNKSSNNTGLAEWCTDTLAKLNALINIVKAAETQYKEAYSATNSTYNALLTAVKKVGNVANGLTVQQVEEIEVNGVKVKDLDNEEYRNGIDTCNKALASIGADLRAENPAQALLYYYAATDGKNYSTAQSAFTYSKALSTLKFAELGGSPITTANLGDSEPKDITVDNYDEVLSGFLTTYPGIKNDPDAAQKKHYYYPKLIMSALMDYCTPDSKGWVKSGDVRYEAFASSKYEAVELGNMLYSGILGDTLDEVKALVEANKFTDEKLEKLHKIAVENGWMGHYELATSFIQSAEGKALLGEYLANYLDINYFSSNPKRDIASLFCNAIATSVEEAKAFTITATMLKTDNTLAKVRGNGTALSIVEMTNSCMAAIIAKKEINGSQNIGTYYSRPTFDFIESNKYKFFIKPAVEESGAKYAYEGDLVIPQEYVVEAVNSSLNKTLGNLLDEKTQTGSIVVPIVNGLLESDVDLLTVTHDLWKNLYNDPVATIFNLIPTLVILVDELVLPLVLNSGDKATSQYAGTLYKLLCTGDGILVDKTLAAGDTSVGITALDFDLNKVIPSILYWFSATAAKDADTAESYRRAVYDMVGYYDEEGTEKISNGGNKYDIPKFTGIYVADKAIAGVWLTPNLARTIYCSFEKEDKANTTYGTSKANKDTQKLADGLVELIAEVVNFAREAVDDYLKAHKDDIRYNASEPTETQRGLNNIFVAIPQIIDMTL